MRLHLRDASARPTADPLDPDLRLPPPATDRLRRVSNRAPPEHRPPGGHRGRGRCPRHLRRAQLGLRDS